jgi:hypothetical protein
MSTPILDGSDDREDAAVAAQDGCGAPAGEFANSKQWLDETTLSVGFPQVEAAFERDHHFTNSRPEWCLVIIETVNTLNDDRETKEFHVTQILLTGYLIGWLVTTVVLAFTVRKMQDPARPQPHPLPLTVLAGAVWPILILGVAEYASVAAAAAVVHDDDHTLLVKA